MSDNIYMPFGFEVIPRVYLLWEIHENNNATLRGVYNSDKNAEKASITLSVHRIKIEPVFINEGRD